MALNKGTYQSLQEDKMQPLEGPIEDAERSENPLFSLPFFEVETIDEWYDFFTVQNTGAFVFLETWDVMLFYFVYAMGMTYLSASYPESFELFEPGSILKVLAFVTGLLISLVLRESLEGYRKCLAAMVDFTDEFKACWYMAQLPLLRKLPAAKIIVDMHMVLFSVSVTRYLMNKAGIELPEPDLMVQKEFRECTMFKEGGVYGAACSNPAYSEFLLVSWLRACGILNGELRKHVEWMRTKLRALITDQRVKSPKTNKYLLVIVTHMFLLWIPWCVDRNTSRIFLPLVAVVLFSLLTLAFELEDPFGCDRHDLPWPVMLANVGHCTLCHSSRSWLPQTVATFNHACLHDEWIEPKKLFGADYVNDERMTTQKFDTGKLQLDLYLTLSKLKNMEIVSGAAEQEPECLFSKETLRERNGEPPRPEGQSGAGWSDDDEGDADDHWQTAKGVCPVCGTTLSDLTLFCTVCGKKREDVDERDFIGDSSLPQNSTILRACKVETCLIS